jgi:hypothetical protein
VVVEIEISAPPNTLLTGGPFIVGAPGPGMIGNGLLSSGVNSTILIGGVLVTAPGGLGGGSGGFGFLTPIILGPTSQPPAVGVDYSSSALGGAGFAISTASSGIRGGDGGSGDYGIGGLGGSLGSNGLNASGNGGGGGGASQLAGGLTTTSGGSGSPGIWIVEDYS